LKPLMEREKKAAQAVSPSKSVVAPKKS
jgi:hypothetical protein